MKAPHYVGLFEWEIAGKNEPYLKHESNLRIVEWGQAGDIGKDSSNEAQMERETTNGTGKTPPNEAQME